MKLKPLFDRVVLKPEQKDKLSSGGIILPQVADQKSELATVVSVGTGGTLDGKEQKMEVRVGQKVLYSKYAGTQFKMEGEEYLILRQTDILAIIED